MSESDQENCCGPGFSSPSEAMEAPRETLLYTYPATDATGTAGPPLGEISQIKLRRLVFNLAKQFFNNIFNCHNTRGTAIFI